MPAYAALHRLHTSSLCLQHSMLASVWYSTARSTRAVSQADACDQPAPSRCPCLAHRCGLCDRLLLLYACGWWYVCSVPLLSVNTARSTVRDDDKMTIEMTIETTIETTTGMTTGMTIEKPTDDKDAKMTAPHITHTTPHIAYPKPHPTPPSDRKRTKK